MSTKSLVQISTPKIHPNCSSATRRSPSLLRLPNRLRLHSITASSSDPSVSSTLTSTVGSPATPPQLVSPWSFSQRHLLILNLVACSVAISATWLFCAAIPTLLAFKRAAESMEKLLDVTREELPGTMAAVRLSGMEISDLTMELSDLGQHISQGVRGSTRAVRFAEEKLRHFTNTSPSASMQGVVTQETKRPEMMTVAKSARNMKETIVKSRSMWNMFFTLTRYSRMARNYFSSRSKS